MKDLETTSSTLTATSNGEQAPEQVKHTPGPWSWMIEDVSMAYLHGPNEMTDHVLTSSPCQHCQEGEAEWKWGRCMTPTIANARLIAAAPALLLALQDVREILTDQDVPDLIARIESAFITIDSAIAQATGAV